MQVSNLAVSTNLPVSRKLESGRIIVSDTECKLYKLDAKCEIKAQQERALAIELAILNLKRKE